MPRGIDQLLLNEFEEISKLENESERLEKLIKFFKLPLYSTNRSIYEMLEVSKFWNERYAEICASIKDTKTGIIYIAKYANNPLLIRYDANHVKHRIICMSYPNNIEREITYSRFSDSYGPLLEETHVPFNNNTYRLTLTYKNPEACFNYEHGYYLSLSEVFTGNSLFYTQLVDTDTEFYGMLRRGDFTNSFINNHEAIFEKIMKKLNP